MGPLFHNSFIFLESVSIYGYNPSLKGMVKIQYQGEKGRLTISLQDSQNPSGLWGWLLYHQGGARAAIKLGFLKPAQGENWLEWEFNPLDVEGTGLSIEEFSEVLVTEAEENLPIMQTRVLLKGRLGDQRQAWQASEARN